MADLVTTIGGASSDSYATEAEFTAYGADMGWTLTGGDTDRENLRRAAQYIDRSFEFVGYRQYETQALAWPRQTGTLLVHGWAVDVDTIPQDIKNAQMEIAYLMQGGLNPFATVDGVVKEAGAGPARVVFQGGLSTPRVVAAEGLLEPYLAYGRGQARVVRG